MIQLILHYDLNQTIMRYILEVFAKTNPQLDFNPKPIHKLESNAKLT